MLIDKISMDLLKALYKEDLPESRVAEIIGQTDFHKRLSILMSSKIISRKRMGGVPDGAGGYLDGTVKYLYHLEPSGRAAVEYARNHLLEKLLDWGSNILP